MDTYRAILAVVISFVILLAYQYFFVGFEQPQQPIEATVESKVPAAVEAVRSQPAAPGELASQIVPPPAQLSREPREITVENDLYRATFSELGGALQSFVLKQHKETNDADSPGKELVMSEVAQGFPLKFSWGSAVGQNLLYDITGQTVAFDDTGKAVLTMQAQTGAGLQVERIYTFTQDSYLIDLAVVVKNSAGQMVQGVPQLHQVNPPFQKGGSPADRFLFRGPAAYANNELQEVKAKEFAEGPLTLQGPFDWVGYEGNYFLRAIIPQEGDGLSYVMQGNEDLAYTAVAGNLDTIEPGAAKEYTYRIYYGPKKVDLLREVGYNLEESVNFGWFDFLARPTLFLLNFFFGIVKNYGIAIIMVTVMFKAVFWPITQKGMKSMKNMQKLQPKMMKIKEKYKDDPTKMNQEVMNLYRTYKVNPMGGCLPLLLQIPVFFALYKVLLQSIELRHAPFMLWITDLSAPDRLWIGFDLPWLGGIPVLTLLMGASMFVQQKLTPTTADPTQARIMMFLPVIFTFMFLNFASGLVLYWFINNLLAILQQQLINRESKLKQQQA